MRIDGVGLVNGCGGFRFLFGSGFGSGFLNGDGDVACCSMSMLNRLRINNQLPLQPSKCVALE
jgi:hypothetical protein